MEEFRNEYDSQYRGFDIEITKGGKFRVLLAGKFYSFESREAVHRVVDCVLNPVVVVVPIWEGIIPEVVVGQALWLTGSGRVVFRGTDFRPYRTGTYCADASVVTRLKNLRLQVIALRAEWEKEVAKLRPIEDSDFRDQQIGGDG